MVRFGYTLMTEQSGPRALVRHAPLAERAGFDFQVISDHFSPWLNTQAHAPYAWSVLGAICQATERTELMTYVTAPIMRYHPAVVAQKAATVALLSGGRFTLGIGAGENLNEHVVGRGWPGVNTRHAMLGEAIEIITELFDGDYLSYRGEHFTVDSAKLWDVPDSPVPIAVAISGAQSVEQFAPVADGMIAVEPDAELCRLWDSTTSSGNRKIGQLPVAWGLDRDEAVHRAWQQFRWFAGGWKVNAELPAPPNFHAATRFVREDDVADNIPCGPDVDAVVSSARVFWEAGFTDLAFVQIGGDDHQDGFFEFAERELLPALRDAAPRSR
ncbi:TIGR03557 family F420-dependent LLM class oxidoreductase [Allosaccharopolyspora coralli]|uniref:TIGR03557 family F420-dependent LLM class oxidoreductase n=1 Tax=Allosaccharopolyspora coralli TaxID=2665642 RepID=A0A5Q3Q7N6_9PSEU|nr:TIGR03557 family F420-dependent LLM class oxidoreductase [Allosaccharopolyspora coralli]QGK70681.1 TIGR03557 family F420-dependent LLM class oxidoreductase [Allosaccharopolyspora coralli]